MLHNDGDASASDHDITLNGSPDLASGHFGDAMYFDGSADYLTIPDSDDWNFGSGDFTIDFWLNFSTMPDTNPDIVFNQWAVDKRNFMLGIRQVSGNQYGFETGYSTDGVATNNQYSSGDATIYTDEWHHYAVVRDGSVLRYFIEQLNFKYCE